MGIHDRDWYKDAMRERARADELAAQRRRFSLRRMVDRASRPGSRGPEPFGKIVLIWLAIFALLFMVFRLVTHR